MAFAVVGPTIGGTLVDRCARTGDPLRKFLILIVAPLCAIPAALAVFAPRLGIAIVMVASSSAVFAVIGTSVLTTLQSIVAPEMRGLSVALSGLSNTILGGTSGPLLMAALTQHLYRKPELVGLSITSVAVPALIAGSLLFAFAGRSLRRQQQGGGGAATLMAELELRG
jgi:MFS family permease